MEKRENNNREGSGEIQQELLQKIASLEKQLAHQQLKSEVLDTLINRKTTQYLHQKKAWNPTVLEIKKTKSFVSVQQICCWVTRRRHVIKNKKKICAINASTFDITTDRYFKKTLATL